MKVAVISDPDSRSGKTVFNIVLGTLFARTQQRTTVLLATDKMNDALESVRVKRNKSLLTSVAMLESVLTGGSTMKSSVLDYGIHIGEDKCYAYDIYDSSYDMEHLNSVLMKAVKKIKAELVLVEVNGSVTGAFEQELLREADVVLYLFNTNLKSLKHLVNYKESMPEEIERKTGYICSMYNPEVIGEKLLAKKIASSVKNVMLFPYNPHLAKEAMNGTLDTVAPHIAKGDALVLNLRSKLLEVMQYLFDTGTVKYILDMTKWFK